MKLTDLQKEFDKLQMEIKAVLSQVDYEMDNVQYNRNDLDETFVQGEFYSIINQLKQIDSKLTYLKQDIKEEARLIQNANGRFEFPSGYEFTSGSHCEILYTSTSSGDKYWLYTTIEHNGEHYYATSLGKYARIDFYLARIR